MENNVYIWGKNPVKELIQRQKREVIRIYVLDSRYKEYSKFLGRTPVRLIKTNRNKLSQLTGRKDHQGLVAETTEYPYTDFNQLRDASPELILISEGVTDPQNLGAMIRSAFLLGVGGLIIENKYSATITPVVTHTSAGATDGLPIACVDSLHHSIHELKRSGYTILATHQPDEDTIDVQKLGDIGKVAYILGSEGSGIRNSTLRLADKLITIPQAENLDSFSVSAATAIITFVLASSRNIV